MQADLPPILSTLPLIEEVVGEGEKPDWLLVHRDVLLVLRRAGLPEIRALPVDTQDTPNGRVTVAAIVGGPADARLTFRRWPGICRILRLGETTKFIGVSMPDGGVLHGCASGKSF